MKKKVRSKKKSWEWKKKLEVKKEVRSKKKSWKWKKIFGSRKKLAEVKNIGCTCKTILMENVAPRSHRIRVISSKTFYWNS